MGSRKIKLAAILLFLLNLALGLAFINEGLFHLDSVVLARATESTYKTGYLHLAIQGRIGVVMINSILYFPFFLLGQNADFVTRFSSVLFCALSISALFLVIWELCADFIQAICGGLLFSITPLYFSPNTFGKEHGMSMFFFFLSFYLLLRGVKKDLFLVGLSSFLFAFAISVRESICVFIPFYLLLYLAPEISLRPFKVVLPKERLRLKPMIFVCFPFLLVFSGLLLAYLKTSFYREIFLRDYYRSLSLSGLFSPIFKLALQDLWLSMPGLIFLFAFIGSIRMFREKKNIFLPLFLLLWFMLIFYFANASAHYSARYLDSVVIPVHILAAYTLSRLYAKDRLLATAVLIYFLASMFIFMYPILQFRHRYNGAKRFALFVKANTEPEAIIISMDDSVFIEYYAGRRVEKHPASDDKKMHDFLRKIAVALVNKTPVYLTTSGFAYDDRGTFYNVLLTNFDITTVGSCLSEDYHRAELKMLKYNHTLFKLDFKFK